MAATISAADTVAAATTAAHPSVGAASVSASGCGALSALLVEWMSRSESEQFLQHTLDKIQALDKTVQQHQIVRDGTNQALQAEAHGMEDVPQSSAASSSAAGRLAPTFINITPPTGSGSNSAASSPLAISAGSSAAASPRSPISGNGRVMLSPNPHPLDPSHLQVDEVSLRASPTSGGRRVSPIDAHSLSGSPSSSPSPPTSPLASPNSLGGGKKRFAGVNKPLNLPSSPRLTSPSPPRSPARHIASPTPQMRSPQTIRQFYFPEGVPPSPGTKKREQDLIEQLFRKHKDEGSVVPVPMGAQDPINIGLSVEELFPITTLVCGFSSYCNSALFERLLQLQNELKAAAQGKSFVPPPEPALLDQPRIHFETFLHFHTREIEKFDLPTRFFRLLRGSQTAVNNATAADPAAASAAAAAAPSRTPSSSSSPPLPTSSSSSASSGAPRRYLIRDDFKPIVQEIVNRHPGLEFLESTPEFQLKYAQTVIARIFYQVNRMGNECLTLRELRSSNFLLMLALLDQEDDINKLNDYFSYEHFYVVYCKFWELDEDHDGYIDANDLIQYDDYALTNKVVDRLMSGAGRKLLSPIPHKMNYLDFVIFLISEVDKNNDVSLDYWFGVVDIDGDGVISTFEIEYFFEEQKTRIQSLSQELITFPDIMCQMVDMVKKPLEHLHSSQAQQASGAQNHNNQQMLMMLGQSAQSSKRASLGGYSYPHSGPAEGLKLRLREKHGSLGGSQVHLPSSALAAPSSTLTAPTFHSHHKPFQSTATHVPTQGGSSYNVSEGIFYKKDLRDSKMAAPFFNTLFNLNKFVLSEQRDPIRIKQCHDTPQLSDWDRYAISGYYRLASVDELPGDQAQDAAQAWADMADGGHEDAIELHEQQQQLQQQQLQQQQQQQQQMGGQQHLMDVDSKK